MSIRKQKKTLTNRVLGNARGYFWLERAKIRAWVFGG